MCSLSRTQQPHHTIDGYSLHSLGSPDYYYSQTSVYLLLYIHDFNLHTIFLTYYAKYVLKFNLGTMLNVLKFDICTLLNVLEFNIRTSSTLSEGRIFNLSTLSKVRISNLSTYLE